MTTTLTILTMAFLIVGASFTLLAAIGILRLPDLFTRMQASTKAATLGVACVMMAALSFFADLAVSARAVLIIGALFLTAPVAAHAIGRAAYLRGVELWEGTLFDELKARRAGPSPRRAGAPGDADREDREAEDQPAAAGRREPASARERRRA
jgi:multicomponent Na+:H+ antiporter subunit G